MPDLSRYFHLTTAQWDSAVDAAILYGSCAAFAIVAYCAVIFVREWIAAFLSHGGRSKRSIFALAAGVLKSTKKFSLAAAALALAIAVFGMWNDWLRMGFTIVLIVKFGLWVSLFVNTLLHNYAESRRADHRALASAVSLMRVLAETALWSVVLIIVLSTLGINVTAMVAGLGIGGIAIGFAAQGIFADLFGSLAIVFDQPFVQGDFVVFGDNAGTVENIGIKSTRIRALSGEQIVLSNANMLGSTIHNYQRLKERRILFGFGVTYQTPYALVRQIPGVVRNVIEETEGVRFDRCHFKEYGDSALQFEVVYYVLAPDYNRYMDIQQHINLEMMRRFEEMNVEFAYPTQTLFFGRNSQTEPRDRRAA